MREHQVRGMLHAKRNSDAKASSANLDAAAM